MQKSVQIMVEMKDAPAAKTYATALQAAQAQADATRSYALAHPTLRTSQATLNKNTPVTISTAAASQVRTAVQKIDQAQRNILPSLTSANIGGQVLFRAQRAYNGIAMSVSPSKISAIAALPGVKAIHPLYPKYLTAAFSDIDFLGTRTMWTKTPFGIHGENIKVADIDTGLDYVHVDFGGSGSSADYSATSDTSAVPNANFPTPKIPGGIDLVGDAYTGSNTPVPDNNPFDCNGHGTGTASLIGGFGVTNGGFVYSGSYDASNPAMSTLSIAPGQAPNAKLFPVRVFGCSGSTNVVTQAIEWAMDPNGDGNFSDHMDVINMSLGADEGFADDADDVAASNAASIGIQVCSAAGNAGDSYYIHSSPAAAGGTLSVAASFNNQNGFIYDSNVTATAPASIAGQKYFSVFGAAPVPHTAVPPTNLIYAVPNDGGPDQGAGPYTPYSNAASINGKICLVDRGSANSGGSIGFATKIGRAKASGAIACIVDNFNNPGQPPTVMGGLNANDNIPAVMISRTDRDTIVAASGGFDPTTGVPTNTVTVSINLDSGSQIFPSNPPGSAAGAGSPDTVPSYTSRGPRLPDSAIKPDITAPAEVVGVAAVKTGNGFGNFNGTSSATPHVAGIMALLRQLHPTFSVQELNALACDTATHDLATTVGGSTLIGVGRVGAGRIDAANAANANVVAYNGTDPNLIGVSFGVVETPADGSRTLTKNITISNKGATNVTYNLSIQNNPALAGATYSFPGGSSVTVNAGATASIPVQFTATGNLLKHAREASVAATLGGNPRQWLTEAAGYAVLTPTDSSPTVRVALYAAPKPTSSMHATSTGVVPTTSSTGSFTINLSGTPVNTGAALGNGFDILSLVKAFELQYASTDAGSPGASTDPNVIKYVGVTSDYPNRTAGSGKAATRIVFGIEGFGDATTPDFASSDKEIFIDSFTGNTAPGTPGPDGNFDYAAFLTSVTGAVNVFITDVVNLHTNALLAQNFTNGLLSSTADTNIYNNSAVTMRISASTLSLLAGGTGPSLFQYIVVTFDRNGNEVDETPVLTYDVANPGLDVSSSLATSAKVQNPGALAEDFMYQDLPSNSITVNYNGTNFQNNGSQGVLLLHMHNGDGNRADVVAFRRPTITSFSPTSGKVGTQVTITGSNFGPGTVVKFFVNKPAATNVLTSNTLVATVPAGAVTGPITVSNAAGSSTSNGNFTVTP